MASRQKKAAEKKSGLASIAAEEVPIPRREENPPAREKEAPVNERRAREERPVEKLQPVAELKSWQDYAVGIGIGALVVVSVGVSLYLYLAQL